MLINGFCLYVFLGKVFLELLRGAFEEIGTDGEGGFCVVDLTQFLGVFKAVAFEPAFDHPVRMRLGEGKMLNGVLLGIGIGNGFAIFCDAAQNGVDQFADMGTLGFACK